MTALNIVKSYREALRTQTGTNAVIVPTELKSDKFFVSLSLLPHPNLVGNGRIRLRLRGTIQAVIPASDTAINDCMSRSIALAHFFNDAQGFSLVGTEKYGMAYHTAIREDDELFTDLSEDTGFVYSESWFIELEFDESILSI